MEKHIVSFSGGKDSTAMLLMMIEKNMPIDEIIFCDTTKEFPEMYEHINQVEKMINRPITRLQAPNDFDYYMFKHKKIKGKNKGKRGYGWATTNNRWCTRRFKKLTIDHYLRHYTEQGITIHEYHGIALDEPDRIDRNNEKKVSYPLYDWGITEAEALQYCYDRGLDWGGLYEYFTRVSCWCCPLKGIGDLKALYIYFPELWESLKDMDRRSMNHFRLDYTLDELETLFKFEREFEFLVAQFEVSISNSKMRKAAGKSTRRVLERINIE